MNKAKIFIAKSCPKTENAVAEGVIDILCAEISGIERSDVVPHASIFGELYADEHEYWAVATEITKVFGVTIPSPEAPAMYLNDPRFVQDGKFTREGILELCESMPSSSRIYLYEDPDVKNYRFVITVKCIIDFIIAKQGKVGIAEC